MVKKVLMVCLGNICRSPIAEAVMQECINKAGLNKEWEVDSAAVAAYHIGKSPDSRALSIMKKYGLPYSNRARQIQKKDFSEYDYIFGMDDDNIQDLKDMAPEDCKAKVFLLGDFGLDKKDRIIEDPYYQRGEAGFEKAYQQCVKACDAFLKQALENNV